MNGLNILRTFIILFFSTIISTLSTSAKACMDRPKGSIRLTITELSAFGGAYAKAIDEKGEKYHLIFADLKLKNKLREKFMFDFEGNLNPPPDSNSDVPNMDKIFTVSKIYEIQKCKN